MAINRAGYRQFNYARLMDFNEQLSRWIYKKLVHRYRHASLMHEYHFSYQDVRLNSGLCQSASEQFNRRKVITALEELKANGAISCFTADERKEGKKIVDVVYTLTAAMPFITEQKAANKRFGDPKAEQLRAIPSARR